MAEQNIVELTRKILVDIKGYPDPADCKKRDSNNMIMYAQDDYRRNEELKELLKHSSKSSGKKADDLWTDRADYGKPEFIITNTNSNLAIVIECKPAKATNNHISNHLRDEGVLVQKASIINKYAVDGALHYAKFLSKKYDVIAIGVSGIQNSNELQIGTYYWEKGKDAFYDSKFIEKTVKGNKVKEELKYCYGPFLNLKIDSLQSYNFYQNFIEREVQGLIKEFNEEKAMLSANELNVMLDGAGVNPTIRALLVSGFLLALRDNTFRKTYEDKEITSTELQLNLNSAIERVVNNEDIQDDFKKKVLKDKFKDAFNQQDLIDNNAEKLRMVLEKLHKSVFPYMTGEYSVDVIGKFYHEFLNYAKNGHNSGIKLTPPQTTELFCDLADLKATDIILDPCLGTGGFLIAGMNYLYKLADKMNETDIDEYFEEKIENGEIKQEEVKKIKSKNKKNYGNSSLTINDVKQQIRKNQLVGCENDNIMYTLGCSNMILRGDGKSNILLGDAFKREEELKKFKATVGFMNPPYSESEYTTMQFVEYLCRIVKKGSRVVVIVPTSAVHSDEYLETRNNILKNNKLLGVMSMSPDLFKGIADTITCIVVLEAGTPHNFDDTVYFGNWKEDGYYWHKVLGMIPDNDRERFEKTPAEYKEAWLKSFRNKNIDDEYGIWRKLSKTDKEDGSFNCNDEWLWEYFVDTDYSILTKEDFEKEVKAFMMYQLKQLELSEMSSLENDNDEEE